jgi:anti-sigma28 factor (negative regulator of flagellin synthesis)
MPISETITTEVKKVEQSKKTESAHKGRFVPSDKSEFSAGARERLSETQANVDVVKAQVSNQPEVRADKVEEVRKKIESGYYNSPEFLDKLTDKVLNDFGYKAVE